MDGVHRRNAGKRVPTGAALIKAADTEALASLKRQHSHGLAIGSSEGDANPAANGSFVMEHGEWPPL